MEILTFDELENANGNVEFEGADHGGAGVSFFVSNAERGRGPSLHTHDYPEVLIPLEGQATLHASEGDIEVGPGHVMIVPRRRAARLHELGRRPAPPGEHPREPADDEQVASTSWRRWRSRETAEILGASAIVLRRIARVLSLAVPAAASAATRCVGTSGPGCDGVYPSIGSDASAGSAVNAAASGDTIRIGPGSYTEEVSTSKLLHFVGAGSGTLDSFDVTSQTRILGPSGTGGKTALTMKGGGSVGSMQVVGGNASSLELSGGGLALAGGGAGGALDYLVSDVVAIAGTGGYGNTALTAFDGARAINVTMTGGALGGSLVNAARFDSPGSSSSITGVTVRSAADGISAESGTLKIVRSNVLARVALNVLATTTSARAEAVDSVFAQVAAPGDEAAALIATLGSGNSTLIARGSTFVARRTGASAGIELFKSASNPGALSADLLNTIVRTESTDPDAYDLDARTDGTVTADFSSFTTRRNLSGGTTPAPGSANNVFGDPGFMNSAAGDLTLRPDSPLIDRGDQALVLPGELDAAGNLRSLDGNGDCVARPDIGAFERPDTCPGTPPNTAPSVTRFSMTHSVFAPLGARAAAKRRKPPRGTKFRYTLSEAARVTIAIQRRVRVRHRTRYRRVGSLVAQKQAGRQSTRFSGRLKHRALRPGRIAPGSSRWMRSEPVPARGACASASSGPSARARPACASP